MMKDDAYKLLVFINENLAQYDLEEIIDELVVTNTEEFLRCEIE